MISVKGLTWGTPEFIEKAKAAESEYEVEHAEYCPYCEMLIRAGERDNIEMW